MKGGVILFAFVMVAACDRGASQPKSCEEAFRAASKRVPTLQDPKTLGKAVGECISQEWPAEARKCVADVRDAPDLAACLLRYEKHEVPKQDESARDALNKMRKFTDDMCACKDTACAQKVSDEMTKWSQEMVSSDKTPPKMTEADTKEAQEIGTRMGECMQRAMTKQ